MQSWKPHQKHTVAASFISWTLDAFDFFILVFLFHRISAYFNTSITVISFTVMLTLICRPIGAFLFGILAEKYGRKRTLLINVASYSIIQIISAFSPTVTFFMLTRLIYGIAMGGVWGVASTLAFEQSPAKSRGVISGLFQAGYPFGYLLASVVYGIFISFFDWRGMFILAGLIPLIFLLPYLYFKVPVSDVWLEQKKQRQNENKSVALDIIYAIKNNWKVCIFIVIMMAAFNFFSHGTQDLYPTFLTIQHHLDSTTVSIIAVCYNISSIIGGIFFGIFSQRIGRRNAILIAALLALPVIPLWAFAGAPIWVGLGAVLMQFFVQGAWGVVPTYLNELTPKQAQTTLPGFAYQLGNVIASINAPLQAIIAEHHGGNYGVGLAWVAGTVSIVLVILMLVARLMPNITNPKNLSTI
ncbi:MULTISPECIES: MFS transporter [unclassified Francisella]|uniref:MFS transporter n=1 Tax=unclassified Francisella TaxID=2610885 RepID=UPI002E36BEE1|nr:MULTISPECIES: MFS transporter [unclassified Francisella]MED7818360.1 MFS transporter [Francisella sp. 19S2-4]MED7829196.1 MFS transporter [Francisella sp. 19S2-10]